MGRSWWCVVVTILLMPVCAHADRVVVLVPKVTGSRNAPSAASTFRNSFAGGLTAAGHEVVPLEEVDQILRTTPALAACETTTCFRKLGELVNARAVLSASVEVLGSSNYQVRIELYDVGDRGLITSVEDACTICRIQEANDVMSRAAQEVGHRYQSTERPAPAPIERASAVVAPPPPAAPTWTPRAKVFLGLGITSLVLGAGGVGAGAALLAIDGRTSHSENSTGVVETSTTHTLVPGAVLTAVGGALIVGGSILLWRANVARHHR